MKTLKFTSIIVSVMIGIFIFSCLPMEPVTLHSDLAGVVTDAETSEPVGAASVKINNTNDTTSTRNDGTYLLKNIIPGDYEVQVSKFAYAPSSKNIEVDPAKTKELNFALNGIPVPCFSADYLDFGLDSTSMSFTIFNCGRGGNLRMSLPKVRTGLMFKQLPVRSPMKLIVSLCLSTKLVYPTVPIKK